MPIWLLFFVMCGGVIAVWLLLILLDDRPTRWSLSRAEQIELAERIRRRFVEQFGVNDPSGPGAVRGGPAGADSSDDVPIDAIGAKLGELYVDVEVGPAGIEVRIEPVDDERGFAGIPRGVTVHLAADGYEYDQRNSHVDDPPWTRVAGRFYLSGDGTHELEPRTLEILERQWPSERPPGWAKCTLSRGAVRATTNSHAPGYQFDFRDLQEASDETIRMIQRARAVGSELLAEPQ